MAVHSFFSNSNRGGELLTLACQIWTQSKLSQVGPDLELFSALLCTGRNLQHTYLRELIILLVMVLIIAL